MNCYCYDNRIENLIKCNKCLRILDEPLFLPCGKTICSLCASGLCVDSNNQFDCLVCSEKHEMSKEGLPLNESILELLSIKPCELSRGESAEALKESLKVVQKKLKN